MRALLAAFLLLIPALTHAQPARADAGQPSTSTLPPIGLPLPQIGLPLPPIGLAPGPTPTTSTPAAPAGGRGRERGGREHRGRGPSPAVIYVVPAYGWSTSEAAPRPDITATSSSAATPGSIAETTPPPPATGTLRLDLQPRATGQLFVDGAYVGTLDELGTDLTLAAGTRRLEIRQAGYQPFELTARIDAGRALVYKGTLVSAPAAAASAPASAPAAAESAPPAARIVRKPLYYIPGCYLGDVPPKDAGLPPTCDVSRAVVYKP